MVKPKQAKIKMVIESFINKLTFFPAFLDIICCLTIFEKTLENCEQTLPAGFLI